MNKLIVGLLFLWVATYSSAKDFVIIADNNNSIQFQKEKYYLFKILNETALNGMNFSKVVMLNERKTKEYNLQGKEVPRKKSLRLSHEGIMDTLERVVSHTYTSGDTLVFISSMDYKDKRSKTSALGKKYNDAWITSSKSPLKKFIDNYPNTPLSNVKVAVLDPSHDLKYLKNRERFFSFFFARLGAKLVYFGSLDGDSNRLKASILSQNVLQKKTQKSPLRNELHLMLDDQIIQYELP